MPRKEWLAKQTPEKKAEIALQNKLYLLTDRGKKSNTCCSWKSNGLIADNIDEIYERYINSTHCECCRNEYKSRMDRHMDHCTCQANSEMSFVDTVINYEVISKRKAIINSFRNS